MKLMEKRYQPEALMRRLNGVPEAAMREALWREYLQQAPEEQLSSAVHEVLRTLRERRSPGHLGYMALLRLLGRSEGRAAAERLFRQAWSTGDRAILNLDVQGMPVMIAEEEELLPIPLFPDREVTLGERRSYARRPDREILEKLLQDPDPRVLDNLLRNPRIREQDILKISSKRPVGAAVLEQIFLHPVWGRRRAVQLALVLNPYSPVYIASGLAILLEPQMLKKLKVDPATHPLVRERIQSWLLEGP